MTNKIEGTGANAPQGVAVGRTTGATAKKGTSGASDAGKVTAVTAEDSVRFTQLATELSAAASRGANEKAPLDSAKVDSIKTALADGSYVMDAKLIAKRLLSAEKELKA